MSGSASAAFAAPPDRRGDPIDRVVALFAGPAPAAVPETDDWSASLTAVRGLATRVRTLQTSARDS
ncbi:MAG: hypothetical protein INR63_10545, partial [Actinomycetospora chiangmaiensis]|nr:hypothetical protein [Actinomycetospora chiangmaiensis]